MHKRAYRSAKNTLQKLDYPYIMRGGFWMSAGQGIATVTLFVLSYIFANYVDPTDYGLYRYILSLAVLIGAFSLTGMPQSVLQATVRGYHSLLRIGFKTSLMYSLIAVVVSLGVGLYYYLNGNIPLAIGCLIIAAAKPLLDAGLLAQSYLNGLKKFKAASVLKAGRVVLTSSAVIATIFLTENILYVVFAYFIAQVIGSILVYVFTLQKVDPDTHTDQPEKTRFLKYAKNTSVRNIINGIASEIDKVLAFQFLGATELAVYAFAIAIPEQIKGGIKNIGLLVLIKFTGYDLKTIKAGMQKKVFLFGLILSALTIIYIVLCPLLYSTFFPAYEDSILLSQIFALSFLPMVAIFPINALQAQMKERELHTLNIVSSILLIVSAFIGVFYFGLMGLVISRVVVRYITSAMTFALFR